MQWRYLSIYNGGSSAMIIRSIGNARGGAVRFAVRGIRVHQISGTRIEAPEQSLRKWSERHTALGHVATSPGRYSSGGRTPFAGEEKDMKQLLISLVRDDQGQDLIEYGLLVGVITVGAITAILAIGPKVANYFTNLDAKLPAS